MFLQVLFCAPNELVLLSLVHRVLFVTGVGLFADYPPRLPCRVVRLARLVDDGLRDISVWGAGAAMSLQHTATNAGLYLVY